MKTWVKWAIAGAGKEVTAFFDLADIENCKYKPGDAHPNAKCTIEGTEVSWASSGCTTTFRLVEPPTLSKGDTVRLDLGFDVSSVLHEGSGPTCRALTSPRRLCAVVTQASPTR